MSRLRGSWKLAGCLAGALLMGCGNAVPSIGPQGPGGSNDGEPAGNGPGGPKDPCDYTLDEIIADLNQSYEMPTWEMLDCFRTGLTRTRPAFMKRLLVTTDARDRDPSGTRPDHEIFFEWWDEMWDDHPVNVSSHIYGSMGPFVDTRPDGPDDWKLIEYPLYPDHHDARPATGSWAFSVRSSPGSPS